MEQGDALRAGQCLDAGEGLVSEAALGLIDDAFEGEVVGRLVDQAEVGQRVADFGAFVEAEAPDDAIRHADGDEAVLEFARLILRADEDGGAVEAAAPPLPALDLVADAASFLGAVPHADDLDLLALGLVCEQGLAEAA
ncbi:hypothetical protein SPAN111604_13995 [Sphingomonas antarctica]